jgi:S-methylmethionine-dependent homocysteine/selenocysteine methylase
MKNNKKTVLLDGGMGQELIKRGIAGHESLWSANALLIAPNVVRDIHEDYIRAGADVITTNTYATTRVRLQKGGIESRFVELNQLAGELAQQARKNQGADVLIAGSLPPFHGSYLPAKVGAFVELEPLYREQAEVLAPYVDLFLCETMSTASEALAAATGAASTGKPVWVSWTLQDGGSDKLRSGESVSEAAEALAHLPIAAYLVNCCAPESIASVMGELSSLGDKPVGGYANGFVGIPNDWVVEEGVDVLGNREDLTPERYAEYAGIWLQKGASIIGGCCEVGPAHIRKLRQLLDQ